MMNRNEINDNDDKNNDNSIDIYIGIVMSVDLLYEYICFLAGRLQALHLLPYLISSYL